ncbi:hypothetical protein HYPDE_38323 [Hyphomicrobium denitrificans 1NES1]|uniref:Uncharacterized protein n=1 Tax=Hyphomicrobium denitrificans 1NES1 TaxID=670307 RepID=N0BFU0_9HYPH|nr:hypothetical protein HYPDE_38323 [Hyphomicrobium denitrificans 1NES1]
MAWVNEISDAALLPLVKQLRDALKSAEAELQRRCFISSEIKQALASADAYLGDQAVAQRLTGVSRERAPRLIRRV